MRSETTTIESKLASYIREECLSRNNKAELRYYTNLFDAGIVDSAGLISFICFMEKEFDISIPDEDLLPENFVSITSIATYIRTHQQVTNERG